MLNASGVLPHLRDLIVHLHRGNAARAETIVSEVAVYLKDVMQSGGDPESFEMQRTRQTMFAIDEVKIQLAQQDYDGAAVSARDAAKEWRQTAGPQASAE